MREDFENVFVPKVGGVFAFTYMDSSDSQRAKARVSIFLYYLG